MSPHLFRFKQFAIRQEKSAMKIGTDGVLLGAWAESRSPKKILDIGTGTGLILLMLAQRFPEAELTGIEIDENAFEETDFNISESKFANRCRVYHSSIQEFDSNEKFDLIVSNPPFFENTNPAKSARNLARQQSELSFEELLFHTKNLLGSGGKAAFIIPFNAENEFLNLSRKNSLYPEQITHVRGNENSPVKRSLILLSENEFKTVRNELIIEISRNIYTPEYIELTRDFYLKM